MASRLLSSTTSIPNLRANATQESAAAPSGLLQDALVILTRNDLRVPGKSNPNSRR
ncbi:MAG: hypothetical protein ACYC56_14220 [Candidatus Aquicultor sp.]